MNVTARENLYVKEKEINWVQKLEIEELPAALST